jgi:anthranilate synthase/aminodeoxychorismate synthase-like glutamine amidotransferase
VLLVIDNYDSFTYNLVQYLGELGTPLVVRQNDQVSVAEARAIRPAGIVISPGPGKPDDARASNDVLRAFVHEVPVLGVCLGHQCLARLAGASVRRAERAIHGKASPIWHDGKTLFHGIPAPMEVGRYHSLIVAEEGLPAALEVSARSHAGEIMALRLRGTRAEGVQFHPESILTPHGMHLLGNFVSSLSR